MGGTLGTLFSKTPAGTNGQPSFLQNLVQGATKGAATGFGQSTQRQNPSGGGGAPSSPSPTPVDPRYFLPTTFNAQPAPAGGGGNMSSAFYGAPV